MYADIYFSSSPSLRKKIIKNCALKDIFVQCGQVQRVKHKYDLYITCKTTLFESMLTLNCNLHA
jgi:hypothetical protein